jgi:hypothetical protein
MAITITTNSATMTTTEFFVASNSITATYQTGDAVVQLFLDCNAMAAGDQYRVRGYEKVNGGTARVWFEATLTGAQSQLFASSSIIAGEGWEFSVKKLAGTDRAIAWSLRQAS